MRPAVTALVGAAMLLAPVAAAPGAQGAPGARALRQMEKDYQDAMLKRVNKARSKARTCGAKRMKKAKPLELNAKLSRSAEGHAEDMADNDYFDHVSMDGRTFVDRIRATGYRQPGGENIASGQLSVREVVNAWLDSPGHCRVIMGRGFESVGFGFAFRSDPRYSSPVTYWVQNFGYR